MPPVVWDGDGVDPWLPARLNAIADAAEAERTVYDGYFARLSAWLVLALRAVLRPGQRPDPYGVFAVAPEWNTSMREFVNTTVKEVMGGAYSRLLGDGYRFDARPAVTAHLAEVRNRMVRTPDEVFDLIAADIAEGANRGDTIPEAAERIDEILDATETPRWRNRSTVVARTETLAALNRGRADAFDAVAQELTEAPEPGEEPVRFERQWLSTLDTRTRASHRTADGQRVGLNEPFNVGGFPLMQPGDPAGPPQETIQCRCTILLMEVGETADMSNRPFRTF